VTSPLLGTESFQDPSVVSGAGSAIEGAVYSIPKSPSTTSPVVARFRANFRARYHEDPGVPADVAYDALRILVWATRRVPAGLPQDQVGAAVRDQLYGLRNFDGASGLTTFDHNGDAVKPFEFRVIRSGKFVPADRQLPAANGAQ
jgi:branched-chain amino acid transport system substrate-binding protein